MSKKIAFVNQKGGVGKTTTTLNLGAGLALEGKKVLLIDTDPQGNLSISAGVNLKDDDLTIYDVLKGSVAPVDAIVHLENYDIIPADIMLSGAEIELSGVPGREMILKEALEKISKKYDYILIDCPPSLSTITLMGLVACDSVIIPVQSQYLALNGVAQLLETIELVRKRMSPQLRIAGVLATMYDSRMNLHKEVLETIKEAFPDQIFNTTISNNVALSEAPGFGQDIFKYNPRSKGAQQYKELVKELLGKEI